MSAARARLLTRPVFSALFTVQTSDCDPKTLRLTLKDPSFSIRGDGEVVAESSVSLPDGERTFSVRAQDQNGPESAMEVHLYCNREQQQDVSPPDTPYLSFPLFSIFIFLFLCG